MVEENGDGDSAPGFRGEVEQLKADVEAFAERFPMPGPTVGGPIP